MSLLRLRNSPSSDGALGDDVAFEAALHPADVGGGLGVNAAQGQAGEDVGGYEQGRETVFRLQPGVGGAARDFGGDDVLGRSGHGDAVGRAFAVEDDAGRGGELAEVHVPDADQPALLVSGESDLHGAVRAAGLGDAGQRLQHDGDARLAVAAEDGGAVGAQGVSVKLRLDAAPGFDGVEVGGQ